MQKMNYKDKDKNKTNMISAQIPKNYKPKIQNKSNGKMIKTLKANLLKRRTPKQNPFKSNLKKN